MTRSIGATLFVLGSVSILLSLKVQAHPAWGIAVDRQGQVYFSDLKTVWKIDTQRKLSVLRAGTAHTHELNMDGGGNLYGAENSYDSSTGRFFSAIWMMAPDGSFSYVVPPTANPPKGTSIWRDGDGNMYHVTHFPARELLVLKRTPNGKVTALVGTSNAARRYHQTGPHGLSGTSIGSDGALYFVHGPNVSKITTTGALMPLARDLAVQNNSGNSATATQLFGVAVDAQGNAFVGDYGNRRVVKITPDNKITTLLRSDPSWFPTGVALSGNDLYILENSFAPTHTPIGTRIRKLSPDGKIAVLATVEEGVVSSESSSFGGSTFAETSEGTAKPKHYTPNRLTGLVIAGLSLLFAISCLVWKRKHRFRARAGNQLSP